MIQKVKDLVREAYLEKYEDATEATVVVLWQKYVLSCIDAVCAILEDPSVRYEVFVDGITDKSSVKLFSEVVDEDVDDEEEQEVDGEGSGEQTGANNEPAGEQTESESAAAE